MTRPEVYARSLELVREIVAQLAPYGTVEGLADAFHRAGEIAASAIERSGAGTEGIDVGLATAAAFAMRYRRIVASRAHDRALGRIEEARRAGRSWVTVVESGHEASGPYYRLEMHLADARAVQASVDLDAETGERRFHAEVVRLDPATGELLDDPGSGPPRTFAEPELWAAALAELRAQVGEGGSG
jgi:hypothetical protein